VRQLWTKIIESLTIANGNCNNIKSEIAGKMTSEVRGLLDVAAATTNELKATKSGTKVHRLLLYA
jgi:hypothetical protein